MKFVNLNIVVVIFVSTSMDFFFLSRVTVRIQNSCIVDFFHVKICKIFYSFTKCHKSSQSRMLIILKFFILSNRIFEIFSSRTKKMDISGIFSFLSHSLANEPNVYAQFTLKYESLMKYTSTALITESLRSRFTEFEQENCNFLPLARQTEQFV